MERLIGSFQSNANPPLLSLLLPSHSTTKHLSKLHLNLILCTSSLFNRVSIRNTIEGFFSRMSLNKARTARGLPKPRQFQLSVFIGVGSVGFPTLPLVQV